MNIRSKKLKDFARGQMCTMNILGVCNYDTDTSVWCHLPDESKGMGIKGHDICGVIGCHNCHAAMDGRMKAPDFEASRQWYLLRAFRRTMVLLFENGVIGVR